MKVTNRRELYTAFNAAEVSTMSEGLSFTFARMMIVEMKAKPGDTLIADINAKIKAEPSFTLQIMMHRLNHALPNYEWSPLFLILLDTLAEGSPGNAVMWSAYAVGLVADGKTPSVDTLASQFPNGFPVKAALSIIWDAQKFEGNNLIDGPVFWI